jgi:uncharacterized protein (DUF2126 family)
MLVVIGALELIPGVKTACIELPAISRVAEFLRVIAVIGEVAREVGLPEMVLQGFAPPVDEGVAWTTVTPDPAVIEINQAPQPDVEHFLASMRELFDVAQLQGLSRPRRVPGLSHATLAGARCRYRSARRRPTARAPTPNRALLSLRQRAVPCLSHF